MGDKSIEVTNLTKRFGSEVAIENLTFEIDSGEVLGFVGPNGAGKSTTINAMLGFIESSSGSVETFGMDIADSPVAVKQKVGVVPEDYGLYDNRTGRDHINMSARAMGEDIEPEQMIDRVGLTDEESRRTVAGYSTGMKQRLALGMALVGDPELLILDEPGNGLDPNGIRRLQEIISHESDNGVSVFFSSHILGNIETVCDKIVVLSKGTPQFVGTIDELRKQVGQTKELTIRHGGGDTDHLNFNGIDGVIEYEIYDNNELEVVYERQIDVNAILTEVLDANMTIQGIDTTERSLSELFGEITTRESGDSQ